MPVAHTGLVWGVKASFLAYLRTHTRAEQTIAAGAGQLEHGDFYFTWVPGSGLAFEGSVTFLAHGGMLLVPIVDPAIDDGVLSISTAGERLPLVDVDLPEPRAIGDLLVWDGVPTALRAEAVELFGGGYPAGTPFDPLSMRTLAEPG